MLLFLLIRVYDSLTKSCLKDKKAIQEVHRSHLKRTMLTTLKTLSEFRNSSICLLQNMFKKSNTLWLHIKHAKKFLAVVHKMHIRINTKQSDSGSD
jgi:hypothetical protein